MEWHIFLRMFFYLLCLASPNFVHAMNDQQNPPLSEFHAELIREMCGEMTKLNDAKAKIANKMESLST